ncbi:hypothetical protein [bacterium endosymbiont of Bathymodiolus sp. 5 South]|jgi:hypothetical protein|nr:hypothetical protein [bacterium endosymbiont of Bathymodiolus sp. 5 South]SSC09277.1 hypothetical protein BTURTLESOX_439 [bacterium endosymbiont of Bathymodiolus sp. 5 South]VVH58625.1 hypothetical protein BSPCLSOX_1320 [uncultured Gammaproteobacteria bacterium]VVM25731.1 hypothetical protein BSPWISOXPB_7767 [uncultured Gammaproteobacteria bacterium]
MIWIFRNKETLAEVENKHYMNQTQIIVSAEWVRDPNLLTIKE